MSKDLTIFLSVFVEANLSENTVYTKKKHTSDAFFIWKVTTTKVNFRFKKQCNQAATRLIYEQAIFTQNVRITFLVVIFLYKLKKHCGKVI